MQSKPGAYLALLVSSALFASGYILARAIAPEVDMGMFVAQAMFFCALTISLFTWQKPSRKINGSDIAALVFNGIGAPVIVFLVFKGSRLVTPSLASIIVISNVLMIAALARALGRKKFTWLQVAALVSGFAGIVWISTQKGAIAGGWSGVAFLLGGAVLIASITVAIERAVVELGWAAVTRWSFWIGSAFSFSVMAATGRLEFYSVEQSALAVVVGALSLGIPVLLFNFGMSRLGSADAAAFKLLIPFFALVYGILFLGEAPGLNSSIGGIIVVGSVAVYQFSNWSESLRSGVTEAAIEES